MKPDSNRLVAIDGAVIVLVSAAICLASGHLLFMTVFVPAVILARILVLAALARREGINMRAELFFLALCTALGAFNDWNSVCNHKIYDYRVPHYFDFSTIPIWMLIFWGMILRFIARLARWQVLGPSRFVSNRIGIGGWAFESPFARIAVALILVFVTRQFIYHFFKDPLLSWIPFLAALSILLLLFKPDRHDFKLLGIFLLGGPLVEILYIQVGGLHFYHLGWIGGVPLWIILWWLIIVVIWKDLAFRLERALRTLGSRPKEL